MPDSTALDRITAALSPGDADYAASVVGRLLDEMVALGASDLHLQPAEDGLSVRWRIDGVLQAAGALPPEVAPNIVARLKVLAGLLTYQTDRPQEGRVRERDGGLDVRVSTFPTLYGEKAVIRLFSTGDVSLQTVSELGLPTDVALALAKAISAPSGAIVLAGPAGSGKTTTAYACLREIATSTGGGRSIASLEDPIEVAVDGVAQSQVNEAAGFTLAAGLRSLVRQDPEVILVGEIRDAATAAVAFQAAMTGQLLVTTFHAGSAVEAFTRLLDMGIPPYIVRGATRVVVAQRLLRQLCDCAENADPDRHARPLGIDVAHCRIPSGCDVCRQTGYHGRQAVAEILSLDDEDLAQAVLDRADARRLAQVARSAGVRPLASEGLALVDNGTTSPEEWLRVFGSDGS